MHPSDVCYKQTKRKDYSFTLLAKRTPVFIESADIFIFIECTPESLSGALSIVIVGIGSFEVDVAHYYCCFIFLF